MNRNEIIALGVKWLEAQNLTKDEINDYQHLEDLVNNFEETLDGVTLSDPMICDIITDFKEK